MAHRWMSYPGSCGQLIGVEAVSWSQHSIWWQIYPLGFTGAPVRPADDAERALTHRLGHVRNWLDYAVELGVNGLLLGPVFDSSSHGYDTLDHYRVDPRLGDDADFDALISACRQRGIRVVLDGVFNHVGIEHPLYRKAIAEGRDSREAGLFRIDWSTTPPRPAVFEGHGSLVALDHGDPAVAELVRDVMRHWLARGVSGWRLDAAYAIPPEFWRGITDQLRSEFPDAWFVGEIIHGDYGDYVARSGLDSLTQYELWKSIWSSLNDVNFFELDWTLQRHNEWLDQFIPQTFVGNHDVSRIATLVGREKLPLALTILFTVAGIPSIYYGDEQGFEATKWERLGGDDDIRPMYPATPESLQPWGADVQRLHQELIALRRRNPWLVNAHTEQIELRNGFFRYRSRAESGEELLVTLDLENEPASARITDQQGREIFRA